MDYRLQLTLLSEKQIFGGSSLDIFKKYGTKCAATDLAILTSIGMNTDTKIDEDDALSGRSCWWWTRSSNGFEDVRGVFKDGSRYYKYRYTRNGAVRPALQLSSEIYSKISTNKVRGYNGVYEVEYGEYPQMAPDERTQKELKKQKKI